MGTSQPIDILLVEDSPVDALMIRHTLEAADFNCRLYEAEDGQEAIQFIEMNCYGPTPAHSACPDIIILDLNFLTEKEKKKVLEAVKHHPATVKTPVVILSTSGQDKDTSESHSLNPNRHIKKPTTYAEFEAAVKSIHQFWTECRSIGHENRKLEKPEISTGRPTM